MTKKLRIPKELTRAGVISESGDGEKKSKRISISSDTPYKRYDWYADEEYYEVLSHKAGDIDDARLKAGLPVLFNHQRSSHLGRAKGFTNDGHRIEVGTVDDLIWSEGEDAQTKKKDVESGALVGTSVGYSILDEGVCVGAKDGIPIYEFKWAPHEFSFCTIEADITVGAGRTRSTKDETGAEIEFQEISVKTEKKVDADENQPQTTKQPQANPPTKDMKIKPSPIFHEADGKQGGGDGGTITVTESAQREEQAGQRALELYAQKCEKIDSWIAALPKQGWRDAATKVAESYRKVSDKRAFDEFRTEALIETEKVRVAPVEDGAVLDLSKNDRKQFSLRKAMLEVALQHRGQGKGLTGHEKAVCEAAQKLYGEEREFTGLCIPDDMLRDNFEETHDLGQNAARALHGQIMDLRRALNASTFTAGGALVGVELLAGSMIDILRNAVLIGQGPMAITELSGLTSNISIPKQTGTSTVYWLSEGAAITLSQQVFAQLNLTPKRMGVATAYTKQLLSQASLSVEAFVRSDQALTMAVEEDRVSINGTGVGGEPIGILNTTGVLSNVTFSGAATWADIVGLEYGLENANVRNGQMAILTSPVTKSYLKLTVVVANSTFPIFLWMPAKGEFPTINGVMPGIVNEYAAYATKNMTTNVVLQGVFKNVIKARWAGFDVVVDPYTGALSETINIIVNQWLDVGLRYPQSFNATTDAPTSP